MDKLGLGICLMVFTVLGFTLFSTIDQNATADFQVFDLTKIDHDLRGFYGTTYHNGFVYFTPDHNGEPFGKFVRYDTNKPFENSDSWQIFDSNIISGFAGYLGGGTDGKFLYFPSYNTDTILRYDTKKDFQNNTSWETYNAGMRFWGEITYDGRYVYFLPEHHTMITRFDTSGDFSNERSWQSCDISKITEHTDFMGSSFDGQFLYFPSSEGNFILKYNTQKQFCNINSWEKFDVTQVTNKKGYFDAKFDGRYVYFSPNRNEGTAHGTMLRYDTKYLFTDSSSWISFNPSHHYGMKGAKGYGMMTIVEDHLYLSPLVNWKGYHSNILSYDIHADFDQIESWKLINVASHNNEARGYPTATSDGVFVYFSPYHNNVEKHGKVLRLTAIIEN